MLVFSSLLLISAATDLFAVLESDAYELKTEMESFVTKLDSFSQPFIKKVDEIPEDSSADWGDLLTQANTALSSIEPIYQSANELKKKAEKLNESSTTESVWGHIFEQYSTVTIYKEFVSFQLEAIAAIDQIAELPADSPESACLKIIDDVKGSLKIFQNNFKKLRQKINLNSRISSRAREASDRVLQGSYKYSSIESRKKIAQDVSAHKFTRTADSASSAKGTVHRVSNPLSKYQELKRKIEKESIRQVPLAPVKPEEEDDTAEDKIQAAHIQPETPEIPARRATSLWNSMLNGMSRLRRTRM